MGVVKDVTKPALLLFASKFQVVVVFTGHRKQARWTQGHKATMSVTKHLSSATFCPLTLYAYALGSIQTYLQFKQRFKGMPKGTTMSGQLIVNASSQLTC